VDFLGPKLVLEECLRDLPVDCAESCVKLNADVAVYTVDVAICAADVAICAADVDICAADVDICAADEAICSADEDVYAAELAFFFCAFFIAHVHLCTLHIYMLLHVYAH